MSYRRTRNFTMNFQGTLLRRTRDFIGTFWGHCWDVAVILILGNEFDFYEMSHGSQNQIVCNVAAMSYRRTRDFTMNFQGTLLRLIRDFIGTSWGHCWDVAVISILEIECNFYEMSHGSQN